MDAKNKGFYQKNQVFDCIFIQICKKMRYLYYLIRINTSFWCGRQVSALWAERRNADSLRAFFKRSITDVSRVHLHIIMRFAQLSTTKQKRKPRKRFPFLWCGRQELKTCDDMKKALKIKAFLR